MHSLSRRLLLSVSVSLVAFFGVTIFVLDASFRDVSEHSLQDLLDAQIVALVASAEPQPNGVFAPLSRDLQSRLATPRSGLYAQIRSARAGVPTWRSPSTAGAEVDFGPGSQTGDEELPVLARTGRGRRDREPRHLVRGRGAGAPQSHVQRRREPRCRIRNSCGAFGSGCSAGSWGWHSCCSATLGMLLRWVLAPVRRLEREINAVEAGSLRISRRTAIRAS